MLSLKKLSIMQSTMYLSITNTNTDTSFKWI